VYVVDAQNLPAEDCGLQLRRWVNMWELAFASAAAMNGRSDPLEEGVGITLVTQPCFCHPRRSGSSATVIAKCERV